MSTKSFRLKATIGLLGIASLSVLLAACGSNSAASKPKLDRTADLSANYVITTLDISKTQGFDQAGNMYDSLFYMNKDHKIVPDLATKSTVSKDGKTYTFKLRKDAKFSNGDPITAQSFVYSWQRSLAPATKSMHVYLFNGIVNAAAVNAGKLPASKLGVTATNDHTLTVKLTHPIAYFNKLMTYQAFAPQDEKIVKKYGSSYGMSPEKMVYSGPYKMANWKPQSNTWTFVKNTNYWDKKVVKMHKINMHYEEDPQTSLNLYQSKKLDFTILTGDQVSNFKNSKQLFKGPYSYMNYLFFNQEPTNQTLRKAFRNENIRKAISLTLDRKQIVNVVMNGAAVKPTGVVTKYLAYNNKGTDFAKLQDGGQSAAYNPTLAKQYWQKGLKQIGQKSLKFTLMSSTEDSSKKLAEYIQANAQKYLPGLTINLQSVPEQIVYQRSLKGQFDAYLGGRGADISDPIEFLAPLLSNNPQNYAKWQNATYDKLVNGSTTGNLSTTARWNKLLQAEKLLADQQAVTPLYQDYNYYLKRSTLHGITHNSTGAQWNYKYMYKTK
ncbi:periplasmic oligopeptide-binding protein [Secundilactobacillus silagincola]|uniref:Periplasmic oligopeptide-binding protein n=1 Tax=Secundilactobacillus silagincola TaxID=1714681 RepID=A0A1Z5J4Y2_9LACO|nr:peptide ABC transporter substrate-binding protein [Secundilactobacillus silagincola]GAX08936.1 periplasmic oligopeptide-binding protein [Secundilactobacillus silagincola]